MKSRESLLVLKIDFGMCPMTWVICSYVMYYKCETGCLLSSYSNKILSKSAKIFFWPDSWIFESANFHQYFDRQPVFYYCTRTFLWWWHCHDVVQISSRAKIATKRIHEMELPQNDVIWLVTYNGAFAHSKLLGGVTVKICLISFFLKNILYESQQRSPMPCSFKLVFKTKIWFRHSDVFRESGHLSHTHLWHGVLCVGAFGRAHWYPHAW